MLNSEKIEKHNKLYGQACELVENELQLDGKDLSTPLGFFLKRRFNKALVLFEEVLRINPENWAAMFFMAKIFHRLNNKERAYEFMIQAHQGDSSVSGFAREAGLIAFQLGKFEDGVQLTQAAISTSPNEGSLYSNLGFGQLLAGNLDDAVHAFERADELEPNHPVTPRLLALAVEVRSGTRPVPKSEGDISRLLS